MKITTTKELRKAIRNMNDYETILIDGWGQIQKIGKNYAIGPLPENDDSNPYTDYSAWNYGWKQSWIIEDIAKDLKIA